MHAKADDIIVLSSSLEGVMSQPSAESAAGEPGVELSGSRPDGFLEEAPALEANQSEDAESSIKEGGDGADLAGVPIASQGADNDAGEPPVGIAYIDEKGAESHVETDASVHDLAQGGPQLVLNRKWYCVSKDRTIDARLTIEGDVNLILCDGAKLTVRDGIRLMGNNSLTIYGQSGQTGELMCGPNDTDDEAGIGGNKNEAGGKLTVCGGKVYAYGGEDAAGIGGGCYGNGGTVEVTGGYVEAKGDEYGAGIGGGRKGSGGSLTIRGGHVLGKGSSYSTWSSGGGAGIGGGGSAHGGKVEVYGGLLEAIGADYAAAIGGGDDGNGGTFTMHDGKVVAKHAGYGGAAIGGGDCGSGGAVNIYGGELDATGGCCAAAIGGGRKGEGGTTLIQDAKVTAKSTDVGTGIGGGTTKSGGKVTIVRSEVYAEGSSGAGIGGGGVGDGHGCSELVIEDSTVTAKSGSGAAAIGGGNADSRILLGSDGGDGGTVTIRNSRVIADAACDGSGAGAGIGGGAEGDGGAVVIEGDSVVDAKSGSGAAIGRGEDGDGVGSVKLPATSKLISYDNDGKSAPAGERAEYCKYRNHVKVEACDHAGVSYTKTRTQHTAHCKYCDVEHAGAVDHDFGDGDTCVACGYRRTNPRIIRVSPAVSGAFGITFWCSFPEDECVDYAKSEVTLAVDGERAREVKLAYADAVADAQGLRGFTMPLSVVEMGQKVTATISYADGETRRKRASLADVMIDTFAGGDDRADKDGANEALGRLAYAQANFAHYMQAFASKVNGWEIGADYQESAICYPMKLDVDGALKALASYKSTKKDVGKVLDRVTMVVTFDATDTIDVYITPKKGCAFGHVYGTLAGRDCKVELLDDGRMHVRAERVTPADFADTLFIVGEPCATMETFRIETSLFAYANAMMNADKKDTVRAEAMASLYDYYVCMKDYRTANNA